MTIIPTVRAAFRISVLFIEVIRMHIYICISIYIYIYVHIY